VFSRVLRRWQGEVNSNMSLPRVVLDRFDALLE
jgi:hypothetical protein